MSTLFTYKLILFTLSLKTNIWKYICLSRCVQQTKRGRKQLNIFERKVYRGILGPVYDNEKGNWRILTNKEI